MSAETTVQAVIDNSISRANEAQEKAIGYSDDAQAAAIASLTITAPGVNQPNIPTPPFPPDLNAGTDWINNYQQLFATLGSEFQTQWENFLAEFFPDLMGCITTASDEWICNTIQNGGTGLPANIEQALFDRAQAREIRIVSNRWNDAMTEWAARGFELPAGVIEQMLEVQAEELSTKLSTLNRDIEIENKKLEIDNIRFAITQAVQLRLGAINAAVAYVGAWMMIPKIAAETATAIANARIAFYQAISAYYQALGIKYSIEAKYAELNILAQTETNKAVAVYSSEQIKARVSAAVGGATALGHVASAAFGANNTLSNLGNVTLNSRRTSS